MLDKPGVYVVDSIEAKRIAKECRRGGWLVIFLPEGIASKDQFYDAIRRNCPLVPPLHSNRSWDALADSLWSGLDEAQEEKIAIFWRNSDHMKAAVPDAFSIATDIFADLTVSLADPSAVVSRVKMLLIFQIEN
nr:barstar family protein [Burkholderia ambifaria]